MKITFDTEDGVSCDNALAEIVKALGWDDVLSQAPDDDVQNAFDAIGGVDRYTTTDLLNALSNDEILEAAEEIRPKQFSDTCEVALNLAEWARQQDKGRVDQLLGYIRDGKESDIKIRFG